jgi:O-antigen ligase
MTSSLLPLPQEEAPAKKWTLHYIVGVFWITYWIGNLYIAFDYIIPFLDYYVVTGILLVYIAFIRPTSFIEVFSKPMMWVWVLTAAIPMVMYLDSSYGSFSYGAMKLRIIYLSAIGGMTLILLEDNREKLLHDAALIALGLTVLLNFVDMVIPLPMSRAPGRAAGLWADPNISAAALCSLLIVVVNPRRLSVRDLFIVAITLLAILITFSRSGIIFAVFLGFVYLIAPDGKSGPSTMTRWSIAGGAIIGLTFASVIAIAVFDIELTASWRITSLLTGDASDTSSQGRILRFTWALERAMEFFWTGRGLGANQYYGLHSHNAYVATLYNYGIFGLLLYFFLVSQGLFLMLRYGWKRALVPGLLSLNLLYYGMFAHTVPNAAGLSIPFIIFMLKMYIEPLPENPQRQIQSSFFSDSNAMDPTGNPQ